MLKNAPGSLWQWFPVSLENHGSELTMGWRFVGDRRFTRTFFSDDLVSVRREICQSSAARIAEFRQLDCLQPTAFLFHSSRCGSTLVVQLLATLSRCIVISEAPIVDAVLKQGWTEGASERDRVLLPDIVRALGQRRRENEQLEVLVP